MKIKPIRLKKGDLSVNVIIMAAIAILVMLVLITVFTRNISTPANEVKNQNEDSRSLAETISEGNCPKNFEMDDNGICQKIE